MKVTSGCWVTLVVELQAEDGQRLDEAEEEHVRYRHGDGELLPGIERAVEGQEEGSELTVDLAPEDAFGPYEPEGLFAVPRTEFAPDAELEKGAWVTVSVAREDAEEDAEEGDLEARIAEISEDEVVLDANHPLAGRRLVARVRILGIEDETGSA